ncbi:hypothetical protein [Nitrosopumilus sp.]|uniref:hypothetical protein n=1 Tax=Nitrosopumilus sp. TaxID=2024843 RepID=UPI003D124F2A
MIKIQNSSRIIDNVIFAIFGFAGILLFFLVVNAFDLEEYPIIENMYATDILFIILPVIAIILGVILSVEYRFKGNHGKAWIFFTVAITIWFAGELTYSYDTEVDPQDISTLTSDIFYISGYPIFFVFTIFYLKSRSKIISRKTIVGAVILSATFGIPTLYLTIGIDDELSDFEVLLYGTYPLLATLLLVPSIIAASLFFRGHVGLLWLLMMMGAFTDVIADTLYLTQEIEGSYGAGNLIDVFYLWSYVFYSLGAWSFIKTYRDAIKKNQT